MQIPVPDDKIKQHQSRTILIRFNHFSTIFSSPNFKISEIRKNLNRNQEIQHNPQRFTAISTLKSQIYSSKRNRINEFPLTLPSISTESFPPTSYLPHRRNNELTNQIKNGKIDSITVHRSPPFSGLKLSRFGCESAGGERKGKKIYGEEIGRAHV